MRKNLNVPLDLHTSFKAAAQSLSTTDVMKYVDKYSGGGKGGDQMCSPIYEGLQCHT